jgi:RNA polymerase sigma-70 factor (ECF subfamily)
LISKVARRDKNAFGVLYDRYSQLALSLAWRILNEREEAEDAVQEAFLQVWREAGSYDPKRGNVSTWLTTIARSRAIDKLRSRKARKVYDPVSEDFQEVAERLPDKGILRDGLDNRLLMRKVFGSLSVEQRVAIEMAYYEGMSQTEIAEALREPLGTIKTRIRGGLLRLRELLGQSSGSQLR